MVSGREDTEDEVISEALEALYPTNAVAIASTEAGRIFCDRHSDFNLKLRIFERRTVPTCFV